MLASIAGEQGDARFAVGIERTANSHLSGLLSIVKPARTA
jgi:hypothetical protein